MITTVLLVLFIICIIGMGMSIQRAFSYYLIHPQMNSHKQKVDTAASGTIPPIIQEVIQNKKLLEERELLNHLAAAKVSLVSSFIIDEEKEDGGQPWFQVYVPRWHSTPILEDIALRNTLEGRFLEKMSSLKEKEVLCAISTSAAIFISGISSELERMGIVRADFVSASKNGQKVILFDMIVNTGFAMERAYRYYCQEKNQEPYAICALIFNDFLPHEFRDESEKWAYETFIAGDHNEAWCLIQTSQIIPYFDPSISRHLIEIRKKMERKKLISKDTQEHLRNLQDAWIEKDTTIKS
jgi:hypothetical protein